LVTCDDGVESPGLRAAARALPTLGDLLICAPCTQQSGAGRSMAASHDGAIHEIDYQVDGRRTPAYGIHGSPAQAVLHAILELVEKQPALCVSGINFGENVGARVTTSGTVGAAIEAAAAGVPALAVSLETAKQYHFQHSDAIDFSVAAHFTQVFASRMLARRLPPDVDLLKIDIPCDATETTPWRVTRVSRQNYFRILPSGRSHLGEKRRLDYRVEVDYTNLEPDSDIHALLVDRVVSVTPISLDLTSRVPLQDLERLLR
jgi:5'-nucleotidase